MNRETKQKIEEYMVGFRYTQRKMISWHKNKYIIINAELLSLRAKPLRFLVNGLLCFACQYAE